MSTATFDPVAYKRTTREQWQAAAEPWCQWGPTLEEWLGGGAELVVDLGYVSPGGRVLDVAAGAGGQTLAAARRVGANGSVLATDISENILEFADRWAQRAGVTNVATRVMDGEQLDVGEGFFDAVICRLGFMYFPEQQAAFAGMRRALKPGGRLPGGGVSTPGSNGVLFIPRSIVRRRVALPAPLPGQPGPFSFGAPGVIEAAYEHAGFTDTQVRRVRAPLRMPSAAECVRFERESFGALHQMLGGLSEPEREEAWSEIEQELSQFETQDGFEGPCELIIS